jgi:hypothetical protein
MALLDGGPCDGKRVATELDAPEVLVSHEGVRHRYIAATGPVADRWRQDGVVLYSWEGPQ